jgi:hypothetical protein
MREVAKEAIFFIWGNKNRILNSIKYPCTLTIALSLLINPEQETMDLPWAAVSIIQAYLYFLIVVRLHRIFLMNESEYSLKGSFMWRNNNTSYLLATIAIGIMGTITMIPILIIAIPIFGYFEDYSKIFITVILIPIGYILSRFSLVLPSIAINGKIDFRESWNISKGNGWKVFILITLTPVVFNTAMDFLYYDNIALRPVYPLLGLIVLSLEIIILSNTFKKLTFTNITGG